jgi:hypothetical protein
MPSKCLHVKVQGPAHTIERLDRELAMYDVAHPSLRPVTAMVQMTRRGKDNWIYKPDWRGRFTVIVFDDSEGVVNWVTETIERTGFVVTGKERS